MFGFPQLVRFSWSTAVNALEDTAFDVEWEEVEDESKKNVPVNNTSITSFFKMTSTKPVEKHEFFKLRHLSRNVEF